MVVYHFGGEPFHFLDFGGGGGGVILKEIHFKNTKKIQLRLSDKSFKLNDETETEVIWIVLNLFTEAQLDGRNHCKHLPDLRVLKRQAKTRTTRTAFETLVMIKHSQCRE